MQLKNSRTAETSDLSHKILSYSVLRRKKTVPTNLRHLKGHFLVILMFEVECLQGICESIMYVVPNKRERLYLLLYV